VYAAFKVAAAWVTAPDDVEPMFPHSTQLEASETAESASLKVTRKVSLMLPKE